MRYWTGLVLVICGAVMLYLAIVRRKKVLAAWREVGIFSAQEGSEGSWPALTTMAVFGEMMRPIILFVLVLLGVAIAALFVMFDGGTTFSYVDLAGLLFLLAAYATWFALHTKYSFVRFRRADQDLGTTPGAGDVLAVPVLADHGIDPNNVPADGRLTS